MRLNILHAIHDFLPRHQAGSEIYTSDLCKALQARHHITVLAAEYDPGRRHGSVSWRMHDGLPVVEVVNNWECEDFTATYRSPVIGARLAEVLDAVQPDVLHVHNLLNLSFDLPALARARGIPVAATLHDYTLVCPSGGQRVHRAEAHVCREIDPARCARCFPDSPFHEQMLLGRLSASMPRAGVVRRAAVAARRHFPRLVERGARLVRRGVARPVTPDDIRQRLASATGAFESVDVFVAPVSTTATEYERLGVPADRIRVADYGTRPFEPARRVPAPPDRLRIGYVGTLAWHKGVHVLLDALHGLPPSSFHARIHGALGVYPGYVADLRRAASGLPVTFVDSFERDRLADTLAEIDVLVVPSLWLENSPLVIHEASVAGVPVVGARIGGIADLIRNGENGLLYDSTSSADLTAVLRRLIDEPGLRDRLATGSADAETKTIDEDARDWEAIYHGLLTRSRG